MIKKQSGFTLIELVVVMVILGILAAVALPKFVDMSSQARIAKMQGAVGSVNSAITLIHAKWLAVGSPTGATAVAYEGGTLTANVNTEMVNGYPAADAYLISGKNLAGLDANFTTTASGTAGAKTMTIADATKSACSFTVVDSTASGTPPVITSTALTTTNC
ncbi:type II secretion system protein [Viridibacterium curvum]|uniref:Uncharacterized protein n=1 Tax=Viridibacterium curvum TaxID=1101404 RepID=A0ABP9R365_9RHOO